MEIFTSAKLNQLSVNGIDGIAWINNSILEIMSYFSDIYNGVKTLLTGMSVTGKYFLNARKGAITQQYPENRKHTTSTWDLLCVAAISSNTNEEFLNRIIGIYPNIDYLKL